MSSSSSASPLRGPRFAIEAVPEPVRAHGLEEAHAHPLVSWGKDATGLFAYSFRRPVVEAWTYPSIEYRTPNSWPVGIFDLDGGDALDRYIVEVHFKRTLPPANWIVVREASGHAQVFYTLLRPVLYGARARLKPQRAFARFMEYGASVLEADPGYNGVLAHNPCGVDPDLFEVRWGRELPYLLDDLTAYPAAARFRRPRAPRELRTEPGRNCALFEALMRWAGAARNLGQPVEPVALAWNQTMFAGTLRGPLPGSEVRGVAKSVERYRREWIEQGRFYTPAEQQEWGRRRGRASGAARRKRNAKRDRAIVSAFQAGASLHALAREFGMDRKAVRHVLRRDASSFLQLRDADENRSEEGGERTTQLILLVLSLCVLSASRWSAGGVSERPFSLGSGDH